MRRTLVFLALGALMVTAACSDDDDEGGFSFNGGGGGQGEVPGAEEDLGSFGGDGGDGGGGGDGASLDDASRSTFVEACSAFPGSSTSLCECAWGEISTSVPASEYAAFEEEFLSDPSGTSLPDWLTSAVAGCS